MRRFVDRQAAERAKLDDPGQFRVDGFQPTERFIQRQDGHRVRRGDVLCFVDRHTAHAVAPLAGAVTTGVIDQDPAHDLRRDTKEVGSILPIDLTLVDQPDVHLMNEGRRLQGVVGSFAPQLPRGNAPELRVDERQQLIERGPVAATPIAEQRRDVARAYWILLPVGLEASG